MIGLATGAITVKEHSHGAEKEALASPQKICGMVTSESEPLQLRSAARRPWLGGSTAGNGQLTATVGVLLLVLLAVLGVTIIRIGQLLWLHLFLGLLLIGPVTLKMASTGYRFMRYYTASAAYRRKGPPHPALRALAPVVVLSTIAVFATGVLLLLGRAAASPDQLVLLHKISFIVWLVAIVPHVLGHLLELPSSLRAVHRNEPALTGVSSGGVGRAIALVSALVAGAVLAVALLPQFTSWTH
jgi:hypothetical protein